MAFDINKINYDGLSASDTDEKTVKPTNVPLHATMLEAVKINPDEQAKIKKLSGDSGVPLGVVKSNPEKVKSILNLDAIDFDTMSKRSPKTSEFLMDYGNASIAHDDTGPLQYLEKTFRNFSETTAISFKEFAKGAELFRNEYNPWSGLKLREETITQAERNELANLKNETSTRLIKEIQDLNEKRQMLTPQDLTIVQEGIRGGVDSLVQMVPGFAAMVLSGGRAAPLLTTMGAQTFSSSFGSARSEGLTVDEARKFAAFDAAIEVGTEMLPTKVLETILTGSSKGLKKDALKFLIREMGTEQLATLGQTINSYAFGLDEQLKKADSAEEILQIQLRRQAVTAISTIIAGGAQATAAVGIRKTVEVLSQGNQEIQMQAEAEQQTIDSVNTGATKSKLKKRDKETFRQFMQNNAEDSDVFINSEEVAKYLDTKTPEEIAADPALTAMQAQITETTNLGTDVTMSVADFATDVVGIEHYEALRDYMTLSQRTPNPANTEEQQQEAESYIQKLMAEAQENATEYLEAQDIFTKVRDELIDTGRMTPQQASVAAQLVPAWATVKAKSRGIPVKQVYEDSGLRTEGPQTGRAADLAEKAKRFMQKIKEKVTGEELKTLEQKGDGEAKGFYEPENSLIRLTESADLSTFIHEFAHFMYNMELKDTTSELTPQINEWFKRNAEMVAKEASTEDLTVSDTQIGEYLDTGTTGNAVIDDAIETAVNEQFARGFETYLMEGKAPSIEMRNIFRTIARWLSQIYNSIRGNLQVKLDDEMRQVFDRLIATEEQIANAEARMRYELLFTDAAMAGMTEEQFEEYKAKQTKTEDKARETLRDKLIKQLTRQTESWWKEEKADIIDEELTSLKDERVYLAAEALRSGILKLDRAIVKELYGEQRTDKRGKTTRRPPEALRNMTVTGGEGVHPDEAAGFLGYSSGDEMIQDLIKAPRIGDVAEANAQQKMIEKYGDILNDGTIEKEADEALQNEERGDVILAELTALSKGTTRPAIDKKTLKSLAEDNIGKLSFRNINPAKYRKAEIKAAQEAAAALATGDRETAAMAKTRQAMNFYLGMAATNARNDVVKIVERTARYKKKSVREAVQKAGNEYWGQIVKVLERFELRKGATLKEVDEINQAVSIWANQRIEQDGDALVLSAAVLDERYVTHWKNVPYNTLVGISDSLKNMEHVARYSNKMNKLEEGIEFQEYVQKWVTSMNEKVESKFKSQRTDSTEGRHWGRWAMAGMTKIPFLASWLDGGERAGLSHDTLVQPFTNAYSEELKLWEEVGTPVMTAILNRSKEDIKRHNKKIFIPEIKDENNDGNLYGSQVLSVALNVGNASNLKKLLLGEGWANPKKEAEININNPKLQAVLKHMTKSDWELVQLIWDQMDKLYPQLAEIHRKTTGVVPPKVEAVPVKTQFGVFKGGYYPVKYDPNRSIRAKENEDRLNAQAESMFGGSGSIQASVNASATNERTGYFAPIRLNMDVIPNHFQESIHYITHHDAVREINKLINNKSVIDTITAKLGSEEFAQLKPWLNDIAKYGRDEQIKNFLGSVIQRLRFGVTLGVMGFKASTGLIQTLGLSNTIAEVGIAPVYKAVGSILGNKDTMQDAWNFAVDNSKVMKYRAKTMDREILTAMKKLEGKHTFLSTVQEASMKHIALIQTYIVDLPSWHAAYIKGMEQWDGDEQRAYKYADWVVENIQGSGAIHNMAQIMRDQNQGTRLFTMFMTFFSSLWNTERDVARGARTGLYSKSTVAAKIMFLFTIPVFLEMLLRGEFGGDDEDEDATLQKYLLNLSLYPVQTVPFLRDVASGALGDYGYNISPIAQVVEAGVQSAPELIARPFTDEEITKTQVKSTSKLIGAAIGVPGVNQFWATGEHLYEVLAEGEKATLRGLLYGPKK